jgi:tetratricopeptide (TPR) repeat protein
MSASHEPSSRPAIEHGFEREQGLGAVAETSGSVVQPTLLPPPKVPPHAGTPPGTIAAILLLILAFLLAFMPVRNSDFWLQLAAGRNLLEQRDPSFSYLEETRWLNHSWLYQILLYDAYSWLGETPLTIFKACLAAAFGLLLLLAGRVGRTFWIPAGATMLTLIAMGPWLPFRPVLVSYLCFAITICILRRWENRADDFKTVLPLAVLFALWVNLDGWFVLGCLLVGCWCVGQLLLRKTGIPFSGRARPLTVPVLLFLCCMAACVVNPNHVLVFLPRAEWTFSEVAQNLRTDPLLRAEIQAPWELLLGRFSLSGPGLAYWLLLLLSALSFCLSRKGIASRGVVWGVFLILSFLQTQVIPFLAMVAGVTLALNAGAWLATARPALRGWAFLARGGLVLTALALAAGAWIGLFQSSIREPRGGTVDVDPAVASLAERIKEWRQQGRLGKGNGFHWAPETANQLAWFCPDEKSFLNSHLRVSPDQASDYVAVRKGLLARPGSESTNWRVILRAHNINHVVIYSNNAAEVEAAVGNLVQMKQEWPLLYLQKGAAIFGWRDPERPLVAADPFTGLEKNLEQLAYSPKETRGIPAIGTEGPPQRSHWWHAFWKRRPFRTPNLREASLALSMFEALKPRYHTRNVTAWNAGATAGLVAEQCLPVGFSLFPVTAAIRRDLFFSGQDGGPPAALYLAIRAARRAVAHDPDEPRGYFLLGEAYFKLENTTRERLWANAFPGLGRIRTVQAITAYHNALRLDPNLATAHDRLFQLFKSMDYKDLALKHLREYLRCLRRQGPSPGETRKEMEKRLARPEGILQNLTRDVEQLKERFEINSSNLKVLDRATLAGRMGLAGKALDILLDSDISAFGASGMDLELKLLLLTGNADTVRRWMNKEHENILQAYHWNKVQLHASLGNFALADEELQPLNRLRALNRELTLHSAAALILSNGILAPIRGGPFQNLPLKVFVAKGAIPLQTYRLLPDEDGVVASLLSVAQDLTRRARLDVLRGFLALESGRISDAKVRFEQALAVLTRLPDESESTFPRIIAEHFLKMIRAAGGKGQRRTIN